MNSILQVDDAEIIRIEYALMEEEDVKDIETLRVLLEVYSDDMNDCIEGCKRSIKREKLCKLRNNIQRLIGCYLEEEDELSDVELDILNRRVKLAQQFNTCFKALSDSVSNDNIKEVGRLAKFTNKKFLSNLNYLDELHRKVDLTSSGICYQGCGADDSKAFLMFFEEEIERLAPKKQKGQMIVEKIKK